MTTATDRRWDDALGAARARFGALAPRLPAAVALVCAIGAGFAGARLVWQVHDLIWPAPVASFVAAPRAAPTQDPGEAAARLASSEAFGRPGPAALDEGEAPDSQLALTLRGVIAAADPAYSRAFIAASDGQERGYALGAAVPGGAVLQAVHPDRVVLARNGALETLRLPRDAEGGGLPAPSPVEAAEVRNAQANPSRLLDWMRPVVATEANSGRQLGYRVYPGRDPERFSKLGLMPGDLVTAVNGQPLDDPSRSMELMRNLTGSDNITLTVERDGAQRLVQIPVLQ